METTSIPGFSLGLLLLGLLLLAAGRRLFWLALAGAGFLIAHSLAQPLLDLRSPALELALAVLAGILGAFLAVKAQEVLVRLGGLLGGGALGIWLAVSQGASEGLALLLPAAIGGVLGFLLSAFLFETALVLTSSLIGAALIVEASPQAPGVEVWLFAIAVALGIFLQTRGPSRRRRRVAT